MTGNIEMGSNVVSSTFVPVLGNHLTNKSYVDSTLTTNMSSNMATKLSLSGGTMTGAIDMGSNRITSTATPTLNADLTNKLYVDAIASRSTTFSGNNAFTGNLSVSGFPLVVHNGLRANTIEPVGSVLSLGTTSQTSTVNVGTGDNTQTINIGAGIGVTTINIGGTGDIVNIQGNINTIEQTNLNIQNKQIFLNSNASGSGTARNAGILIRDAGSNIQSYITVNGVGTGFLLKAPEHSREINLDLPNFGSGLLKCSSANVVTSGTGTISDISGLQAALDGKLDASGGIVMSGLDIGGTTTIRSAPTASLYLSIAPINGKIYQGSNDIDWDGQGLGRTLGFSNLSGITFNSNVTMNRDLSMGGNKVTSSATPATNTDLTNKLYVDTQVATRLATSGGTMTGPINFSISQSNLPRFRSTKIGSVSNYDTWSDGTNATRYYVGIDGAGYTDASSNAFVFGTAQTGSSFRFLTNTLSTNTFEITQGGSVLLPQLTASKPLSLDSNKNIVSADLSQSVITNLTSDLASKASLSGSTFTGSVTVDNAYLTITKDGGQSTGSGNVYGDGNSRGSLYIQSQSNTDKRMVLGYDQVNDMGVIQGIWVYTATRTIALQPGGGDVRFGNDISTNTVSIQNTGEALQLFNSGHSYIGFRDLVGRYAYIGRPGTSSTFFSINIERAGTQLYLYAPSGILIDNTLSMNNNKITNLGTPTATGDATNKSYVDTKASLSGATFTGSIVGSGSNPFISTSDNASFLIRRQTATNPQFVTFQNSDGGQSYGVIESAGSGGGSVFGTTGGYDLNIGSYTSGGDVNIYRQGNNLKMKFGSSNTTSYNSLSVYGGSITNYNPSNNSQYIQIFGGGAIYTGTNNLSWDGQGQGYQYTIGGYSSLIVTNPVSLTTSSVTMGVTSGGVNDLINIHGKTIFRGYNDNIPVVIRKTFNDSVTSSIQFQDVSGNSRAFITLGGSEAGNNRDATAGLNNLYIGTVTTNVPVHIMSGSGSGNKPLSAYTGGGSLNGTWTGTVSSSSDRRIKSNIVETSTDSALSITCSLKHYSFDIHSSNDISPVKHKHGFIAQEVKEIIPEAIHTSENEGYNDFHFLDYTDVLTFCVPAVQELSKRNTALSERVLTLTDKNAQLEERIARLERLLSATNNV